MGLKVNFTQSEAESTAREIIPSGSYLCNITDVKTATVKPGGVNEGKPFWNLRFTVQDGKYAGNSVFSNVMLFETDKEGTLSSLAMLLKALGYEVTPGEMELPDDEDLMGKPVVVIGRKLLAGYDTKAKRELPDRFKVTGYRKADGTSPTKSGSNSMLP
jgi:hypothetical protein